MWEPLHYLRWKQTGRFPLIHRGLSTFSGWIWTQPVERMRPAGTCLQSFPRCGWESRSCPGLCPVLLPPREGHTCPSIFFQMEGIWAGSTKGMETKPHSFGALHPSFLPTPSLHLHIHCFPDLRYLESACQCRFEPARLGLIPGSGRSPRGGNGNPLPYSCLEIPMNREACRATIQGVAKSWTRLSNRACLL